MDEESIGEDDFVAGKADHGVGEAGALGLGNEILIGRLRGDEVQEMAFVPLQQRGVIGGGKRTDDPAPPFHALHHLPELLLDERHCRGGDHFLMAGEQSAGFGIEEFLEKAEGDPFDRVAVGARLRRRVGDGGHLDPLLLPFPLRLRLTHHRLTPSAVPPIRSPPFPQAAARIAPS